MQQAVTTNLRATNNDGGWYLQVFKSNDLGPSFQGNYSDFDGLVASLRTYRNDQGTLLRVRGNPPQEQRTQLIAAGAMLIE